jgi:hypothetical protein
MSEYPYTCANAVRGLDELASMLADVGVLQVQPDRGLLETCIGRCTPCRKEKGPKKCKGWRVAIERDLFVLGPKSTPGHDSFLVHVSAIASFVRSSAGKQEIWDGAPVADSVATAEVVDVGSGALLERHHIDLANPNQGGPTWHYQYGGNPQAGLAAVPTAWIQEPRWPVAPLDFTLLLEVLVSNFFPDAWGELKSNNQWLRLIWKAECLMVWRFSELMKEHFAKSSDSKDRTWLMAQDNSEFDPRPS